MLCQEIAAEARRGVVSQVRLMELQEHCVKATRVTDRSLAGPVLAGI